MLKGLNPLLDADLLYLLAAMGHGDELAIVDRNFPAAAVARRLKRLTGHDVTTVATAIFTVFPIDTYVEEPIVRMQVVGQPEEVPAVQSEFLQVAERAQTTPLQMGSLDRMSFYERARSAYAVVATGDSRGYGNFLISKGGIGASTDDA